MTDRAAPANRAQVWAGRSGGGDGLEPKTIMRFRRGGRRTNDL